MSDPENIKHADPVGRPMIHFPEPKSMGERDWGEETLLAVVPGHYSFKHLLLKAGAKGGLQYHHKKEECGYLVSGQMIIRSDAGDGTLREHLIGPGRVFYFPVGSVHQEEAVTDCVILEVSTPFANDRVRVEAEYGLPVGEGLPSTTLEQVEHIL